MDQPIPRKKILFVITKSNWGGAQRYVYDLATSIHRDEFEVEVILGGSGLLKEKLEGAGIPVTSLATMERDINLKKEWQSAKELYRLVKEKNPDIIHLNSSKAGGIGGLVARLAHVNQIIFTAHGWAFNEDRSLLSKIAIIFFHWLTVMFSHHTIAVSEDIKEQVSGYPFIQKKIRVIHPGIKPFDLLTGTAAEDFLKQKSGSEMTSPRKGKKVSIGMIAELHPIKGLLFALDSVAYLKEHYPGIHLSIIGEGELRETLEKHIEKRRLEDHVTLVGFVDDAKKYLKAFDIFMISSLSEALGYVVLEAGIAYLPVVSTNVGGLPEIIGDAGILVPSQNARALADGIAKLIAAKDLRNQLGHELHERVRHTFSIENMYIKTLELYRGIHS